MMQVCEEAPIIETKANMAMTAVMIRSSATSSFRLHIQQIMLDSLPVTVRSAQEANHHGLAVTQEVAGY